MESNASKITILLAEYNTLRDEVLAARNNVLIAINVFITSILVLMGVYFSNSNVFGFFQFIFLLLSLFAFLIAIFYWNNFNTRKFTKRIREIEKHVNNIAGEELLVWETKSGWGDITAVVNQEYNKSTKKQLIMLASRFARTRYTRRLTPC